MARHNHNGLWLTAAGAGLLWAARAAARRARAYDLRGKVVLITGGSRGLGLVLGRELVREGARVALCARDEEELERAGRELSARGGSVLALPCDVTNQVEVFETVDEVTSRFGPVDVLINNAGTIIVGPAETMTLADYEDAMRVNFWGPLFATMAVVPGMRERRAGRIVNISSIGGKVGVPHLAPYCASKFALTGLSQALRAEYAKDGIVVTTVCPGLMRTGSPRHAYFKGRHRAEYAWFSVADSLPVLSVSAERAARQIVAATKRGEAEVVLTLPALAATRVNALFPEVTNDVLSLTARLLPQAGGIGTQRVEGKYSASSLSPSVLTTLGDRAAERNNEMT
jgi:NAD(P)-dependent dehydrogenase (short-subunit alcohol dehydrogenase family)